MSEEHVTPPGVTAEQLQQGREVAAAAQQAAREEPDPAKRKLAAARAMRREAQRVQLELTEEQARMIAGYVVDDMEARGAFEPPPEPVAAPQPAADRPGRGCGAAAQAHAR